MSMLLIFPPVAKPGEPPAGIARLAGALKANGISCRTLDMNIEGLLHLMRRSRTATDTWTRRAMKNLENNISSLRDIKTYHTPDRYGRAVRDINRVLASSTDRPGIVPGLGDYRDDRLSPLRSADLIEAADQPERNPFYSYFSGRLPEVIENTGLRGCAEGRDDADAAAVVGISLNYLSQALSTFAVIGFIRKNYPGLRIVLGGGLVSSWMRRPGWNNPFVGLVDHLIAGPGEGPLLALFGVSGTDQREAGPDYLMFPVRQYLSPGFILPYSGSSGCYWSKCSFCPETAENNPYIAVPTVRAMSELHALVEATKPTLVHLLDNAVSPALMRAMAGQPIGADWYGFARISGDLTDLDYCIALRRSGCRMLKLGLESGDQTVLDRMRKGIDLQTASQVLRNLNRAGIAAYVYLLFGAPAETIAEARKTLDFVVRHHETITFLNLAVFNMPLCGEEAALYETDEFYEGDLSLYTGFRHPRGWDRKEIRKFLDREFKRHPAVSMILKNDPPQFTSNHAPFFYKNT